MILTKMSHLQQRLIVGSVTAALAMVLIYLSASPVFKLVFVGCVILVACTALWEYYQIAIIKGFKPLTRAAIISTIVYLLSAFVSTQIESLKALPELILIFIFLFFFVYYFVVADPNPMVNLAITMFGFVYVTVMLAYIIYINYFFSIEHPQDGRWWLVYLLAVTKMTDVGGYFIGKNFGRIPLAPRISPKKTREGALGGLVFAIGTSLLFYALTQFFDLTSLHLTLWKSLWLGLLIGCIAQFGDLAESLLKRDAGVKDSSDIPGLGGMLDVVDSLIFTTPLVYIVLQTQ
jgi:phosphatidate cytidylyltransferase